MRKVRASEISIIFQEPMSSLSPIHKISQQMTDGLIYNGESWQDAYDRSVDLLSKVGVTSPEIRMSQYSFELSGGIKQRIMIAIALLSNPSILIADEPTTALDVTIQAQILQLIQNLQNENQITICICDHQARDLLACVDIAMILSNCKIIAQDTPSNLVKDINAQNAYFGSSFKFN